VLRAANILNRGYFDERVLRAMLANLRERLRDGGLLVICRTSTHGDVNNGTLFRLDPERRLCPLARLNAGSEIETLALDLPAQP
jgi:polysaccharide pyruvyl transferase WcaK-like protein